MDVTHPMLTWYLAQLDADERIALTAAEHAPGPWSYDEDGNVLSADGGEVVPTDGYYGLGESVARFVALHDPAAVLADIAVKRRLIAPHRATGSYSRWEGDDTDLTYPQAADLCDVCGPGDSWEATEGGWDFARVPCNMIRLLASAYAHRPGYREEWKPS